jgi:hypothetical protein
MTHQAWKNITSSTASVRTPSSAGIGLRAPLSGHHQERAGHHAGHQAGNRYVAVYDPVFDSAPMLVPISPPPPPLISLR